MSPVVGTATLQLLADNAQFIAEMRAAQQVFRRTGQEIEKGAKGAESSLASLGAVTKRLAPIAASLGIAFGTVALVNQAKDSVLLAARYETLGIVTERLGANVGRTGAEMRAFETDLRKTGISAVESRSSLASMVQAQIDLAKSSDLARIAQDAAVIANLNSSDAFERLVYGIKSAQVEILRTLGLNVSFERGYAQLAAQLGKNVDQLTEQEKTQARVNEVQQAGVVIAGTYEAAMGTAGKQLGSLSRFAQDLKTTLGAIGMEAFREAVFGASDALKAMQEALNGVGPEKIKEWAGIVADAAVAVGAGGLAGAVVLLANALRGLSFAPIIAFLSSPLGLAVGAVLGIAGGVFLIRRRVRELNEATAAMSLEDQLEIARQKLVDVGRAFDRHPNNRLAEAGREATAEVVRLTQAVAELNRQQLTDQLSIPGVSVSVPKTGQAGADPELAKKLAEARTELRAGLLDAQRFGQLTGDALGEAERKADTLRDAFESFLSLGAGFDQVVGSNGETLRSLFSAFTELDRGIEGTTDRMKASEQSTENIREAVTGLSAAVAEAGVMESFLGKNFEVSEAVASAYGAAIKALTGEQIGLDQTIAGTDLTLRQMLSTFAVLTQSVQDTKDATTEQGGSIVALAAAYAQGAEAVRAYHKELFIQQEVQKALRANSEADVLAIRAAAAAVFDAQNIAAQGSETLASAVARTAFRMTDSIAAFASGAKMSFRSFVQSAIADLTRLLAKMALFAFAENVLIPGGGFLGKVGSAILGRAGGGPVLANHPYLIGEKGPELFVPRTSGKVVPNNALGGGARPQVNINVPAARDPISFARDGQWVQAIAAAMDAAFDSGYRVPG
jgi:hypothetical protein